MLKKCDLKSNILWLIVLIISMFRGQNYLSSFGTVIWGDQSHVTHVCYHQECLLIMMAKGMSFNAMLHKAGNRCIGLSTSFLELNFCHGSNINKADKAYMTCQGFQSALERIILPHCHQYTFMQDFLLSLLITVIIISSLNSQSA